MVSLRTRAFTIEVGSATSLCVAAYRKAYRQDFAAIATLLAGALERVVQLTPDAITKDAMQTAFAAYADSHEAASIRRCWSNWNTLCDFLYR